MAMTCRLSAIVTSHEAVARGAGSDNQRRSNWILQVSQKNLQTQNVTVIVDVIDFLVFMIYSSSHQPNPIRPSSVLPGRWKLSPGISVFFVIYLVGQKTTWVMDFF